MLSLDPIRPRPLRKASSLTVASISQLPNLKPSPIVTIPSQFAGPIPPTATPLLGTEVFLSSEADGDSVLVLRLPMDRYTPARPASQSVNHHSPPKFRTGIAE